MAFIESKPESRFVHIEVEAGEATLEETLARAIGAALKGEDKTVLFEFRRADGVVEKYAITPDLARKTMRQVVSEAFDTSK